MVMGIDPAKLAEVQKTSKNIKGVIVLNFNERTVTISLKSEVPEAEAMVPALLNQFADSLAQQLSSFFAIEGEIQQIGELTE